MKKVSLWRLLSVAMMVLLLAQFLPATASAAPVSMPAGCSFYTVRWGDTLSNIAWRYGTSAAKIAADNGIWNPNYVRAGTVLRICPGGPGPGPGPVPPPNRCYVVRWGDSLSGIARMFGVSPWAIASANHIYNLNMIYAGQRLYIP